VRKTAVAVGTSLFMCLATALPALADSSLPQPHGGPDVLGTGGTAGGSGGTAFTGSNISSALMALAVLVVIGLASLVLQRRRAAD
jgi:LPXTG-motif cell wall-anchored protein